MSPHTLEGGGLRTVAVSGSASGIGLALRSQLEANSIRVIGIDLRNAEVIADLADPNGRKSAVEQVREQSGGVLDGLALCAGVAETDAATMVSVNYFGVIHLLEGLNGDLAAGTLPSAVVVSSCSLVFGELFEEVADACLTGDEEHARSAATRAGGFVYPSSKLALARYVRREAAEPRWLGSDIALNVVAPGTIDSPMIAGQKQRPGFAPSVPALMGRFGTPEEVAGLLAYLVGPLGHFIAAQLLFIDGGAEGALNRDRVDVLKPRISDSVKRA